MTIRISNILRAVFIESWWVILFTLLCSISYEQGINIFNEDRRTLSNQLNDLQSQKKKALKEQARLSLEVSSQNDPDWIELTLMKELGLTPEGQTKVFFK